jgi:hypothetical protein
VRLKVPNNSELLGQSKKKGNKSRKTRLERLNL